MPGTELLTVDQWLYQRLTGSTDLGDALEAHGAPRNAVYADEAPADAPTPFVVFTFTAGTDLPAISTDNVRILTSGLYTVKAVGEGPSYLPLRPIVKAMDAAISGAGDAVPDEGEVFGCRRDQPVRYAEPAAPGGRQYRHLGGLYRITAQ